MYNRTLCDLSFGDTIMELNAYAAELARQIGAENVYNFSIGNPSVRPPESVYSAIQAALTVEDQITVHGYSPNPGIRKVRQAIADHINSRYSQDLSFENIYIVPGSSAGLSMLCKGLAEDGDEFIVLAPFFTEYRAYIAATNAELVIAEPDPATFYPDLNKLRNVISPRTKALIVNSPNNPSGVIYPKDLLVNLTDLLKEKEREYGHPIFLISDEPYREIVYNSEILPYLMELYDDTIVSYSYSKSLSLAGDRIGYLAFSSRLTNRDEIFRAVSGAGRIFGHCCAPTLFQLVIMQCIDDVSDIEQYKKNRDALTEHLSRCGFSFVYPEGAFYIMMKTPVDDSVGFSKLAAEKYHLIMVPTDEFGVQGYVRISYCVDPDMIQRSLPAFTRLAEEVFHEYDYGSQNTSC